TGAAKSRAYELARALGDRLGELVAPVGRPASVVEPSTERADALREIPRQTLEYLLAHPRRRRRELWIFSVASFRRHRGRFYGLGRRRVCSCVARVQKCWRALRETAPGRSHWPSGGRVATSVRGAAWPPTTTSATNRCKTAARSSSICRR